MNGRALAKKQGKPRGRTLVADLLELEQAESEREPRETALLTGMSEDSIRAVTPAVMERLRRMYCPA